MDSESGYDDGESSGACGSIKLSLFVDTELNILTVSLKQAVDLIPKRQVRSFFYYLSSTLRPEIQDGYPNPYFKITLDVPESGEPKIEQQSRTNKCTASPLIDEEFFFPVSISKN